MTCLQSSFFFPHFISLSFLLVYPRRKNPIRRNSGLRWRAELDTTLGWARINIRYKSIHPPRLSLFQRSKIYIPFLPISLNPSHILTSNISHRQSNFSKESLSYPLLCTTTNLEKTKTKSKTKLTINSSLCYSIASYWFPWFLLILAHSNSLYIFQPN